MTVEMQATKDVETHAFQREIRIRDLLPPLLHDYQELKKTTLRKEKFLPANMAKKFPVIRFTRLVMSEIAFKKRSSS